MTQPILFRAATVIIIAFTLLGVASRGDAQSKVFSTNNSAQSVSAIDATTGAAVATAVPQPYGLALSPDGANLFVTAHGDEQLYVLRVTDLARIRVAPAGHDPYGVAISPDGRRAYVANG